MDAAYLARQECDAAAVSEEARASLPGLHGPDKELSPEEVFTAVGLQRLRLHLDQGMPEWQIAPETACHLPRQATGQPWIICKSS